MYLHSIYKHRNNLLNAGKNSNSLKNMGLLMSMDIFGKKSLVDGIDSIIIFDILCKYIQGGVKKYIMGYNFMQLPIFMTYVISL